MSDHCTLTFPRPISNRCLNLLGNLNLSIFTKTLWQDAAKAMLSYSWFLYDYLCFGQVADFSSDIRKLRMREWHSNRWKVSNWLVALYDLFLLFSFLASKHSNCWQLRVNTVHEKGTAKYTQQDSLDEAGGDSSLLYPFAITHQSF